MVNIWYFVIGGVAVGGIALAVIAFLYLRSWKIPIVNFKLVGDKRRPVLDLTRRAKIVYRDGVKHLKIRGTPNLWEMKNFKNQDYYLTVTGQPALVLFEFAKDCFAPVKPSLINKIRNKEGGVSQEEMSIFVPVGFEIANDVLEKLLLKAVDDFDPDFIVRNFARIDRQFTGGMKAFLREFGWMFGWVFLGVIVLVGLIMFFQKSPELAAACAKAAVDTSTNIAQRAAQGIAGGPPA